MNEPPPSPGRVLRRLYLTLFLRGRSSRGLRRETAPKSVGAKLAVTLMLYGLFGFLAFGFTGEGVFALSLFLHAMSFLFLGMFIATSAGEILFNKDEAEILMHRPVQSRSMLWAKVAVLVQVSLWLAGTFNLVGLVAGARMNPLFPVVHAVSTVMEAVWCAGSVVLMYQLCLRWFGRERLENLMTGAQVILTIGVVAGGQMWPIVMQNFKKLHGAGSGAWWAWLFPPAWFAGIDESLAGHPSGTTLILAGLAVASTVAIPWLAFGRLADDFGVGVQSLNEARPAAPREKGSKRWLDRLMEFFPPLTWGLRDPVSRAAFRLTAAYMFRDRETKLRLYPGIAPVLVMPLVLFVRGLHDSDFALLLSSSYLAVMPMMALGLLQYSQQWQATDVFRAAPIGGPAAFHRGARHAVLWLLVLPALLVLMAFVIFGVAGGSDRLGLLLPGVMAVPAYAMVPAALGQAMPFSVPAEEASSAGRGLRFLLAVFSSMAIGGLAGLARSRDRYEEFLIGEAVVMAGACFGFRALINRAVWRGDV